MNEPADIKIVIFSWNMNDKEIICQLAEADMGDITDCNSSLALQSQRVKIVQATLWEVGRPE